MMERNRFVHIAGLTVEMRWDGTRSSFCLPEAYRPFLTSLREVHCILQIEHSAIPPWNGPLQDDDWTFFAGGVWAVARWEEGWLFVSPSPRAAPWQRLLWWLPQEERAHLWVHPDRPAEDPLQNLTLPFFAALFARHRGMLVHASAIETRGRAWVFAGPSGSGKSHWAQRWQERRIPVLDEDRVVLRELDGEVWAFGTPWHLEPRMSLPRGAPLERLFFLQEAAPDTMEEVRPVGAAALLLRSCLLPVYDPESIQSVLDVAGRAALQAQSFRLGYHTGGRTLDHFLQVLDLPPAPPEAGDSP